jgi:hypothetical protein
MRNHCIAKDKLSPFVFAGFGFERIRYSRIDILKFNTVLDWNILSVQKIGIKAFAENINFSDTIDYLERGVRDDYYFRFGLGLTYYFQIKRQLEKTTIITNSKNDDKGSNMNRNVLPLTKCFKSKLDSLAFFIFLLVQRKSLQEKNLVL